MSLIIGLQGATFSTALTPFTPGGTFLYEFESLSQRAKANIAHSVETTFQRRIAIFLSVHVRSAVQQWCHARAMPLPRSLETFRSSRTSRRGLPETPANDQLVKAKIVSEERFPQSSRPCSARTWRAHHWLISNEMKCVPADRACSRSVITAIRREAYRVARQCHPGDVLATRRVQHRVRCTPFGHDCSPRLIWNNVLDCAFCQR